MGQASVWGLSYLLSQKQVATAEASASSAAQSSTHSTPEETVRDILALGDHSVRWSSHHATVAEVSFIMRLQQLRAQQSEGQAALVASGEQLEFGFAGTVRSDELEWFGQKSSNLSNRLTGTRRETYVEASQRVAARFEMSLTISGAALQQFTRTAESLKDSPDDVWDSFTSLSNQVLDQSDGVVAQFFDLLSALFGNAGSGNDDAFTGFLNNLFGAMKDLEGPSDSPASSSASSAENSIQIDFQFTFAFEETIAAQSVQQSDPVTLDLDGDGIELTAYDDGAVFDITGSGEAVNTAFVTGGDAFLAIDRNGNGSIDSGKELFGDQNGAANGYEELRKLDSNGDGVIDARDHDFDTLLLFKDDGDGQSRTDELQTLSAAGITSISLQYENTHKTASGGNTIGQLGTYRRANGTTGHAADTILNYLA